MLRIRSDLGNLKFFVSHCASDRDGNAIAGGWPAAANEDGATVCGCDSANGYGGPWPTCAVCEYNEAVDGNYGTCGACSGGLVAHEGECVSECPTGYADFDGGCVVACPQGEFLPALDGTTCVSECPSGEYPVNGVSCSALSDAEVTTALRAEIRKESPNTEVVRRFLAVADADGTFLDGVALLITAAALGHAEVVSVLITAGADPDTRSPFGGFDLNIPLLMATYDGTQQPDGSGELARAKRATVLYHFGDAVEVRGTVFAWNERDGGGIGNHFTDLLVLSESNEPTSSDPILLEMADYALTRGMHCGHHRKEDEAKRYAKYCVGTLGAALAAMIDGIDANTPADAIRTAAQTLADAGVALLVAGDPAWGGSGVVERAAIRWNGPAVSVLITFGGDAETQGTQVRTVPHWVARNSDNNPAAQLEILRHFIGGLSVAGKLSGYGSWNREAQGVGRPLQTLNRYANSDDAHREDLLEIHSLMYERGSRCPAAGAGYCQVPAQTITLTARTTGPVLAVSRAPLGFRSLPATVLASLSANGWAATVHSDVSPHRFVVSRTRVQPAGGGDAAAVFALTMTNAAATSADSRIVMISLVAEGCPEGEGYLSDSASCGACPAGTGAQDGVCVEECAAGTYRETRVLVNAGTQAAIDAIDARRSSGSADIQPLFDALIESVRQWATRQGDDANILAPFEGVAHNTGANIHNILLLAIGNNDGAFPNNDECNTVAGTAYVECVIRRLPRNAEGGAATSGGVCVSAMLVRESAGGRRGLRLRMLGGQFAHGRRALRFGMHRGKGGKRRGLRGHLSGGLALEGKQCLRRVVRGGELGAD